MAKTFVVRSLLVLGALSATSLEVWSQDCARIPDPATRLACYDKAPNRPNRAQPGSDEEKIQEAVRARLKDPASAQFGTLTILNPTRACQTVNARNAYGGYVGDRQAFVVKLEGMWIAVGIEEVSHVRCLEVIKQLDNK